jgi:hypothetical protein
MAYPLWLALGPPAPPPPTLIRQVPEIDPSALASATIPFVVTYLRQLGGQMVGHVRGDLDRAVLGRFEALYQKLKARLGGETFAAQALERLEQQPESGRRQRGFEDALSEVLEGDPSFAAVLQRLVDEASRSSGIALAQISESGATALQGDVTMTGTNVAGRDLVIGRDVPAHEER